MKTAFLKEALKSKEIFYSLNNENYWKKKRNKNFRKNLFNLFLPLRVLRLFICLLYKKINEILFFIFCGKKKNFIILTRTKGIRNLYSLEDYRFKGLEKKLSKYGQVSFFVHTDNNKLNLSLTPRFYGMDFYKIAEFLVYGFGLRVNLDKYICQSDLKILEKQVDILSKFILKNTVVFFWDFNFQHCPLLLAANLKKCSLIGSLHNFTEKGNLPWIEETWPLANLIDHQFINYRMVFKNEKAYLLAENQKYESTFTLKKIPSDLMVLEENFSIDITGEKRYFSLEWLIKNQSNFKNIYIKLRPDNAFSKLFIKECEKINLKNFVIIKDIREIKNIENIIALGTYSSYLLELASKKIICISISNKSNNPFNNPSYEFVEIYKKDYQYNKNELFNPLTLKSTDSFSKIINLNKKIMPSNACLNHSVFKKLVVQLIFEKMITKK